MQNLIMALSSNEENADKTSKRKNKLKWVIYLFYPIGVFRIWKTRISIWLRIAYTFLYLPLFTILSLYLFITTFAAFLPALDKSVGDRKDRTIINKAGNYSAKFLKTGAETGGAYELVEVELEPNGGNDWHYHKSFEEEFTVLKGAVKIGNNGSEILLKEGDSASADRSDMHFFKNARAEKSVLLVKILPASGLEKTLRVAYGLINDGKLKNDMTENPWHMALLLGYSESYLEGMPGWFQEPLINSLAKIAQWRGEDKELYKYFR